jgi:hypothetical protein
MAPHGADVGVYVLGGPERQRELARARAPRRSRLVQFCERILHPLNRVPEK